MERVDFESLIIQDLLGAHKRSELNISPWYQRRAVWKRSQKAYLVNTIHERKPVPTIYIRHIIDFDTERSVKEVVDGQQRVRCILEYRDGDFAAKHPDHEKAVFYNELTRKQRVDFLQTALSVGYLVGASDNDVIEIFARINTVSKTLNPQEKRNAQYSGAFKQFCLEEAVGRLSFWRRHGVFTDTVISRMGEVQFVSDLVMNMLEGLQDFSASVLSKYYEENDETFLREDEARVRLESIFSQLLALRQGIAGTVFARQQVLFSLLLVLDSLNTKPKPAVLQECIDDVSARIEAIRSGENKSAMSTAVYESFTAGNMHRIKSRRARQEAISQYFS